MKSASKFPYFNPRSKRLEKLSKIEQESLVFDLINAFALVKDPLSSSLLIQDLLTASEIKNLSKRLRTAKLLLNGKTHAEIVDTLHCSFGMVAKVKLWLAEAGEGLRKVIGNLPERKEKVTLVKGYYGYGLPQIALTALLNSLESKERKRLESFISKVKNKKTLRNRIQELIDEEFAATAKERKSRATFPQPGSAQ